MRKGPVLRKSKAKRRSASLDVDAFCDEQLLQSGGINDWLRKVSASLPPWEAKALLARLDGATTDRELAKRLGVSKSEASRRINSALRRLHGQWRAVDLELSRDVVTFLSGDDGYKETARDDPEMKVKEWGLDRGRGHPR